MVTNTKHSTTFTPMGGRLVRVLDMTPLPDVSYQLRSTGRVRYMDIYKLALKHWSKQIKDRLPLYAANQQRLQEHQQEIRNLYELFTHTTTPPYKVRLKTESEWSTVSRVLTHYTAIDPRARSLLYHWNKFHRVGYPPPWRKT